MTVTVSMPYFGAPDLVERAVRSVLGQSYRDLHLVVIGDGEEPPLRNIRDSRLDVFTLRENHGAYFAHQLVLLASPHEWWSPHDADDWTERDHLARLVERTSRSNAVVSGAIWFHKNGTMKHHVATYWIGLYARERLLSFGGFNPAERVGQDSLTLHMLRLSGSVARATVPTYHRMKRAGSLTTAPATNMRSPYRKAVRARNRRIVRACAAMSLAEVRAYRARLVPHAVREALDEEVGRLRVVIGSPVAA